MSAEILNLANFRRKPPREPEHAAIVTVLNAPLREPGPGLLYLVGELVSALHRSAEPAP